MRESIDLSPPKSRRRIPGTGERQDLRAHDIRGVSRDP